MEIRDASLKNTKSMKRQNLYLVLIFTFYYGAYTSYFSFLTVYLSGYQYSKSQIGLIFTCISLINLISQPLLGYLSDSLFSIKKILIFGMVVTIPSAFLLNMTVGIFPAAVLSIVLIAFFDYAMIGLLDSWSYLVKPKNPFINYGMARGMGSFSSAIVALIIGDLLSKLGNQFIFTLHGAFMMGALIFVLMFQEAPGVSHKQKSKSQKGFLELWKNKKYIYFIISVFLINIGWRAVVTYLPVIILEYHGNSKHQGMAMAIMTIGIAPVMFIYPKIAKKIGIQKIMMVSYILTIVRICSMALVNNLQMLVWIQGFEALSYGLFQPAMIEYISYITPVRNRTLAISVSAAVQLALCGTIGNYFAGIFLEQFSFRWMYLIFAAAGVIGSVFLIASLKKAVLEKE